ncbi:hypothetical protein MCOR30_011796, partial [Pyricularia oryzae]
MTKQGAELLADEAFLHRLPKVREHRTEQLPVVYEHSAELPKVREHRTEQLPAPYENSAKLPKVREHRRKPLPAPYEHSAQPPKVREHRTKPLPVAFEYGTGLPKVREHSSVISGDRSKQTFLLNRIKWEGFLPDIGAAEHFTTGFRQFVALKRHSPELCMDKQRAGETR